MTNLSTEHTLIAAIPILVVLAVLSAAIIVFPRANLDTSSRANDPQLNQVTPQPRLDETTSTPAIIPDTTEPLSPPTPYIFPQTF